MSDRLSAKALEARTKLLDAIVNPPENFVYDWGQAKPFHCHGAVYGCGIALAMHLGIAEDLEFSDEDQHKIFFALYHQGRPNGGNGKIPTLQEIGKEIYRRTFGAVV